MCLRFLVLAFAISAVLGAQVGCIFKKKDGDTAETLLTGPGGTAPVGPGWNESTWCDPLGDLSAVEANFSQASQRETAYAISEVRYPPAMGFIDGQSDSDLANWFSSTNSFDSFVDRYEVAVHEGSHIWGFGSFSFDSYAYRVIDDSLIIETAWLDNFPRGEILDRHPNAGSDVYADIYLSGSMGSQGFNTLLDEYNAYTHSLASRYCTRDNLGGSTSARDGILTFMFYVETYLKIAREDHASDYDDIVGDADHIDLILSVWDRAEFWLDVTASHSELGIDDDEIADWVYDANNLMEIDMLR